MAYSRVRAVEYAERHWNVPCDDGVFWLTNERVSIEVQRAVLKAAAAGGWQPMFVKGAGSDPEKAVFRRTVGGVVEEKVISNWAGLADCAHFLSRCLTAGGAKVDERGVRELVQRLQARIDTKTLCERVTRERAQAVIDTGISSPATCWAISMSALWVISAAANPTRTPRCTWARLTPPG